MNIEMKVTRFNDEDVIATSYSIFVNAQGKLFNDSADGTPADSSVKDTLLGMNLKELGWSSGSVGIFHYSSKNGTWTFTPAQ